MVLALSVLYFNFDNSNSYDIVHPIGDKHHAIIQIIAETKHSCTAFVITENVALTAGHCVNISNSGLDEMIELSDKLISDLKKTLENLKGCKTFQCLNAIAVTRFQLQQEQEARKTKLKADVFKVKNIYGEDTGIEAVAEFSDFKERDYAVIIGDFKKFETLPLARGFDVRSGDLLRACGYAGSKNPPVCIDFTAISNYEFLYLGRGYLVKGMSGGPVINGNGEVVGINAKVKANTVIMSPIVGIFNRKFDRPKKKQLR